MRARKTYPLRRAVALLGAVWLLFAASGLEAQKKPKASKADATAAAQALQSYLSRVRQIAGATEPSAGSLWTPGGRFVDLSTDDKARSVNDLITIRVVEATQASGSGSLQSKRDFGASSGFTGLFGTLAPTSKLQSLMAPYSTNDLTGQATTASTSNLQTSLTGRVADVLPNGFLVIQAARTITMNGQSQTMIVHGVVRPADIAPDNSVLSTQIGELEVDLIGKGVISDNTRPVGGWMHLLLKFLTF